MRASSIYTVAIRDGRITWTAEVRCNVRRGTRAVTTGPADRWTPADGPEIDLIAIQILGGMLTVNRLLRIPIDIPPTADSAIAEWLIDEFAEDIRDAIAEQLG